MSRIFIVSLGAITKQVMPRTIQAFCQKLKLADPKPLIGILTSREFSTELEQFKLGQMDQTAFIQSIKDRLSQIPNVEISDEDFLAAWNAMNPAYQDYQAALAALKDLVDQGNQVVIYSDTNPIDLAKLKADLCANNVPHTIGANGVLASVHNMVIQASFVTGMNKAQMIAADHPKPNPDEVIYLCQTGNPQQPQPKANYDKTLAESFEEVLERLSIKTVSFAQWGDLNDAIAGSTSTASLSC